MRVSLIIIIAIFCWNFYVFAQDGENLENGQNNKAMVAFVDVGLDSNMIQLLSSTNGRIKDVTGFVGDNYSSSRSFYSIDSHRALLNFQYTGINHGELYSTYYRIDSMQNIAKGIYIFAIDRENRKEILSKVVVTRGGCFCDVANEMAVLRSYLMKNNQVKIDLTVQSVATHVTPYSGSQTWVITKDNINIANIFILPVRKLYGCMVKISSGVSINGIVSPVDWEIHEDYMSKPDGKKLWKTSTVSFDHTLAFDQKKKLSIESLPNDKGKMSCMSLFLYQNIKYNVEFFHPALIQNPYNKEIILTENICKSATQIVYCDFVIPSIPVIAEMNIDCSKTAFRNVVSKIDQLYLRNIYSEKSIFSDEQESVSTPVNQGLDNPEHGTGAFCIWNFNIQSNVLNIKTFGKMPKNLELETSGKNGNILKISQVTRETIIWSIGCFKGNAIPSKDNYYAFQIIKKGGDPKTDHPKYTTIYESKTKRLNLVETNIKNDVEWELVEVNK